MKKLLIVFMVLPFYGCGGHEPNPVASHQIGDGERMCESLRLEIAQNESVIAKKTKKDESKFLTNTAWFLILWPGMDLKEAEKTEAEALQQRNGYLTILMAEKGCGATMASDPNISIQRSKKIRGYQTIKKDGSDTLELVPVFE